MLFGSSQCKFDLVGGKISGVTDRVIYLNSDLVKGIYDALHYEAGEAWSLIFKNCGFIWGRREIERLDKEIKIRMRKGLGELSVGEYIDLIENYFSRQGWGKLEVNLNDAEEYGIVRISLKNSLFDNVLSDLDGSANYMIAGILKAFFEHISQADLDCLEVNWKRTADSLQSELFISGSARIKNLELQINNKSKPVEEALELLRAA